ncbi:sorbosone dehydrogenase family protein [Hymenobacter busanensis]|uniref:Sorbosone dehydrogenase family protein n=1 Tax=Hymenobacter busanensis TaxID=2607656 RepID=A0A7L4ZVN0_9BACT|nr:PQQ-dependent sugar dehydrogenase [Hymenobacter busanensis]KAA9332132.1 sorbosone dehydrogenase family protein [Hymenobacter busanensis]QHJ07529.1 sorbosone dehydrogenase family protein [Hymenobacter busanensis]
MIRRLLPLLLVLPLAGARPTPPPAAPDNLAKIKLPAGFRIGYYAQNVAGARSLALGPDGTVYVGTRGSKVYALPDRNHDGKADELVTIASGLNEPNGVAVRGGALYVAEISRVLRYDNIAAKLKTPPKPVVVYDQLPDKEHHGWKYINFGPDGKLYIPVGAPCNVCLPEEPIFATINRMNPDGTGLETVAYGVRNSVGFDWSPIDKALWFTDNGRDMLGDDKPADELNRAANAGLHFGFPYVFQGDLLDPQFGKGKATSTYTPPARKLGPHVAALGMKFYTGKMFPAAYRNQIFIPEHGSWNRSSKIGYRISLVRVDASGKQATSYETFASGWLQGQSSWGRPVALLVLPDGSLLVSDDQNDCVYRISYSE